MLEPSQKLMLTGKIYGEKGLEAGFEILIDRYIYMIIQYYTYIHIHSIYVCIYILLYYILYYIILYYIILYILYFIILYIIYTLYNMIEYL